MSDRPKTTGPSKPPLPKVTVPSRKRSIPPTLIIGGLLVLLFVAIGLISLVWTPHDPEGVDTTLRLLPPGEQGFLFGTDRLGRDVLTQVMAGARNSLLVGVVATFAAMVPGLVWGLIAAGVSPGWQSFLSRAADVGVALPGILVALVLATSMGPGNASAITAIIVWFVPVVARVVIGPARQVLAKDFVEAAHGYGRPRRFILFRHVVPNIGPLLIVQASVMVALAILIEAALSYLGVGAQRPTPSWGRMLNEAQPLIFDAPYLMIFPGVAIMLAVVGFNLLGDGLRAVLDPQQEARGTVA
jgi:peptide/nickel transport system permease protein